MLTALTMSNIEEVLAPIDHDKWIEIKFEMDKTLRALRTRQGDFVEPTDLSTHLFTLSIYKVNLNQEVAKLARNADLEKSRMYFKLLKQGASKSAAEKECVLGDEYIQRKYIHGLVSGYLRVVGEAITTGQSYLKWKGTEAGF